MRADEPRRLRVVLRELGLPCDRQAVFNVGRRLRRRGLGVTVNGRLHATSEQVSSVMASEMEERDQAIKALAEDIIQKVLARKMRELKAELLSAMQRMQP